MQNPGLSKIVEAEYNFNALLPLRRLQHSPPGELIAAAGQWSQLVWAEAERQGPVPLTKDQVKSGFNLAQGPVFICGVHRSGTTLVRNLLDGHNKLSVLPSEGTFYTNLEHKLKTLPKNYRAAFLGMEWLRRLANPINQPPYWLLGRSTIENSPYVDFARYLIAWWNEVLHDGCTQWPHTAVLLAYASCFNDKAELWVDKTPVNERFLNRIWQEMPAAKIIVPVRNPVAVLSSRKKMESGLNLRQALLDLRMSFKVAVEQSEANNPKFFLVRYEQLSGEPVATMQKLAAFLDIEYSEILNTPTVAGMPAGANSSFKQDAAPGQILKQNEHEQNEALSKREMDLLSVAFGKHSGKLGYPLLKIGFLRKLYLRLRYRLW